MVKLGIIGLGEVAQLMHIPALMDMRDKYQIVAAADISRSAVDYVADRYAFSHRFYEPYSLIESDLVDAVMILSPHAFHAEHARFALQKGKHVFLEKPAALYLEDLEALIDEKNRHKELVTMVAYVRRYSDSFVKLKEMLAEGQDTITYMRARTIVNETGFYKTTTRPIYKPDDIPADVLAKIRAINDQQYICALGKQHTAAQRNTYMHLLLSGCHILSGVRELVGEPIAIKSVATGNHGHHIAITFDYGHFICVFEEVNDQSVVQFDESIEVYQNSRKFHLKYDTPYIRHLPHFLEVVESTKTDTKTTLYGPNYSDAFTGELEAFYECVVHGRQPKTSFEDAALDLRLYREIALKV